MGKAKLTVKTIDALIAAILAYRKNGDSVLRFENADKQSDNKKLIFEYFESAVKLPENELIALTDEAEAIKLQLEQRLTLNAITGTRTNDFLVNVVGTIAKETVQSRDFGIIAWAPKLHNDIIRGDDVKSQLIRYGASSQYIGQSGDKISITLTTITVKYLKDYNSYVHQGHDENGNLVSFFNKNKIDGTNKITARIKSVRTDARIGGARVTVLNYVKVV